VSSEEPAKAINFGLIYGMGALDWPVTLGITRDAAQSYIDRYFTRYPGVAQYMAETKTLAHAQGYVETVFGSSYGCRYQRRRRTDERALSARPLMRRCKALRLT
jgi:DNA polymerase I-like protein with 3'-5' exonuclease and polymerase domains